jgi:predicted O-methyltransferase YrrM
MEDPGLSTLRHPMAGSNSLSHPLDLIRTHGARGTMQKLVNRGRFFRAEWRAWRLFRERRDRETRLEDDLDFIFDLAVGWVGLGDGQKRSEIEAVLRILAANPPRRTLEIGTWRGATLFLLSRVAHPRATLVTVDLPGGPFGGGYGRNWEPILRAMPRSTQALKLIRGDSHDRETLAAVTEVFAPATVDFLLIDGDHSYDGVQQDFEWYSPLVRPSGFVALHDIVPGPERLVGAAPRFWNEIKESYENRELVADREQGGWGIGLLKLG